MIKWMLTLALFTSNINSSKQVTLHSKIPYFNAIVCNVDKDRSTVSLIEGSQLENLGPNNFC